MPTESKYFYHFNTRLKVSDKNKLTRETYCIPTTEIDYPERKNVKLAQQIIREGRPHPLLMPSYFFDIPNRILADEEHYTEAFVKKHYEDCMVNFDLNMAFFESLSHEKFNKHLMSLAKRYRFKEVNDLKDVDGKEGLYILVLDQYKQAYIGKSSDIKKRVLSHWNSRKHFSRLICGKVETSVLSIDSFGALDTTRIFYREVGCREIDKLEDKIVSKFNPDYLLNRVAGGINAETFRPLRHLMLLNSIKKRDL